MRRILCPLILVAGLAVSAPGPLRAAEPSDATSVEDALSGYADESEPSIDDILGGFEHDEAKPSPGVDPASPDVERPAEAHPQWIDRYLDLSGSVSLGASYNLKPHYASTGPDPNPPPGTLGTYYGNLQRLRARADIQADLSLPGEIRGRIQAFGYYDFAYAIHGREKYTELVLQDYELEGEILDFWIQGSIGSHLDLKLGRQVVNWGRSDTLRVTDTLNALNNREPGLIDIEELRLPSTMAKADLYFGRFSLTTLVIPEIRYDYDPPPGNDFFPWVDLRDIPEPPPGFPLNRDQIAAILGQQVAAAFTMDLPTRRAERWGSTPEYGAALTGIFSGWDLSLYAARLYQNRTTQLINLPASGAPGIFTDDDRVTMIGAGGNYTVGAWLVKAEIAWFDELDYAFLEANPDWQITDPLPGYTLRNQAFSRLDWMLGVEYYGYANTTVALELAHRHVFDYTPGLRYLPNYLYEDNVEVALRITSEHMNARLQWLALGLVLANEAGFAGATFRLSAAYELAEGLVLSGGYLHFVAADQIPFDTWKNNNRLFAKIKYSF